MCRFQEFQFYLCSRSLSPFSDEVLYQVSGYTQPWHEQRAGSAEAGLSLPFLLTLFYFDNVSCIMANNNYCILFGFGDPTTKPFTISRRLVPRTLLTWRTTTRLLTLPTFLQRLLCPVGPLPHCFLGTRPLLTYLPHYAYCLLTLLLPTTSFEWPT
uniref:Uncharacterized protein n=1 Tax=Picea sitchensis TaxID=3332 RepID=A0A6B9XS19_PICSI|nr:hypothetical protein Q903MT_gene6790 [Picea sitchensis]